ncbi:SULT2B1 [Branchiostoma lanceolatum]|uniref:Sulfotransferase n=1 Tax=Branchiostoma lanceolatum TaxID=7740 RepID=A0A8J9Z0H1_BRALA|nr:SULT2B1 [Branchiostoma lanceolatum]
MIYQCVSSVCHKAECPEDLVIFSMEYWQQHPLSEPPPYVEYQGIMFPAIVPKESLEAMKTFEIRDDDVVILSSLKSGTNWMLEIVSNILGGKNESASPVGPEFSELELWPPKKTTLLHRAAREAISSADDNPYAIPTGTARPGSSKYQGLVKVIVIMRNPKDVCVSFYYYLQKTLHLKTPESWEQHSKDFLDGKIIFGDYFDHVLGWWQMKDDPHFLFMKYEDLKKDFRSSVKTIAAFLEKELTDEDLDRLLTSYSVESMRKTLAKSNGWRKNIVRKGVVGDWKNHFSAEESAKFDQRYRERMAGSGLEFEFE